MAGKIRKHMKMDNISRAIQFATKEHLGQKRKYSGLPYIIHPLDVMNTLVNAGFGDHTDLLAASVLHDVVEDCDVSLNTIAVVFNPLISYYVADVTKSKENYNGNDRKAKWQFYLDYLKDKSCLSKGLKIADRYCNLKDFYHDWDYLDGDIKSFVKNVYAKEAVDLLKLCYAEEQSDPMRRLCNNLDDIIFLVTV